MTPARERADCGYSGLVPAAVAQRAGAVTL